MPTEFLAAALQPLLFLPGVGMLVMSTSTRLIRLHDEVHHHAAPAMLHTLDALLSRAYLLRHALVALYASIALFAVSSMAAGVRDWLPAAVDLLPVWLSGAAVLALVLASVLLMVESRHAVDVLEEEVRAAREAPAEAEGHDHGVR